MITMTNDKKKSYATLIQIIGIFYAGLSANRDEFDDETNISDFLYNSLLKQFGTRVANEITDMVIYSAKKGLTKKQNTALTNLFKQFRQNYDKVDNSNVVNLSDFRNSSKQIA